MTPPSLFCRCATVLLLCLACNAGPPVVLAAEPERSASSSSAPSDSARTAPEDEAVAPEGAGRDRAGEAKESTTAAETKEKSRQREGERTFSTLLLLELLRCHR
ncbi:hypothetical protein [Propionivibrio limicola]|uniref:hypothetical protein n=1 Tax=Propionivibrio limicola TaxID=167645 RepID=UPI00147938BC|nr:hypothetical protein [Propionivibrio limicola]